jgi:hypothetical protein
MRYYAKLLREPLAASLVVFVGAGVAGTLENQPPKLQRLAHTAAKAMEFTTQTRGGNCDGCSWVRAEGVIEPGTTEKFKAFVARESPPPFITLDSPGGNVMEAVKFGQFLRQSGWNTYVGEEDPIVPEKHFATKLQKSRCYSACVYAFAGGVHRIAEDKSIGIHQFYRPDDALRPNDKTLSAVDMANMQRLVASLNEYVRRMGVDPRLVTLASAITPWEPIYLLSSAELQSLNLDNTSAPKSDSSSNWSVQPAGDGAMAVTTQMQDGTGRMASLGVMCHQSLPKMFIVKLFVSDDTKDWGYIFGSVDLDVQMFELSSDDEVSTLHHGRLIMPVKRAGNGASLGLIITNDEFQKMMRAKTVSISGFTNMASQSWTGPLGGTFSMAGAAAVVGLALKNCVSQ